MSTLDDLEARIDGLSRELDGVRVAHATKMSKYAERSLELIALALKQMKTELQTGQLTPRASRYGTIARCVVEMDRQVMPVELGGRLIEAEQEYRNI